MPKSGAEEIKIGPHYCPVADIFDIGIWMGRHGGMAMHCGRIFIYIVGRVTWEMPGRPDLTWFS